MLQPVSPFGALIPPLEITESQKHSTVYSVPEMGYPAARQAAWHLSWLF
jgi:hypothetical protein